MAETTLTNKVRNPRNLSQWMDIWTATVDENNSYVINPSRNWNISADNLGQIPADKLGQIPVDKISPVNFQDNVEGTEKNYTTTNVTITSEPTSDNLGLSGGVALTNTDGSISERPFDNDSNSYLSGTGTFVSLPSYSLTGAADSSNVKLTLNKDTDAVSNIIINGSGKITTTYSNTTITLNLAKNSVGTNELADESVTINKIDWDSVDPNDSNNTMAKIIKDTIDINSAVNSGIVPATGGDTAAGKIWAADSTGEPGWNNFSNTQWNNAGENTLTPSKLNTKLLGAWISKDFPIHDESRSDSTNNYLNDWDWDRFAIWIEI